MICHIIQVVIHFSYYLSPKIKSIFFFSLYRPELHSLSTNQPIYLSSSYISSFYQPTNQLTFLHHISYKLNFFTTLQHLTRDGVMVATRTFIHIAHHPFRDDNIAAMRSSIHITYYFTRDGNVAASISSIFIAYYSIRDGGIIVTKPSIYIAHYLFPLV